MNDIAKGVAQDLNFDMARLFEVFFHIERVDPEIGQARGGKYRASRLILRALGDLHAFAAATGGRLNKDRVTNFLSGLTGFGV